MIRSNTRARAKAALYELFFDQRSELGITLSRRRGEIDLSFSIGCQRIAFFPATGGTSADIVFVGTHSAFRETVLAQLTDFDLHVYGPGWKKNSSLPRHHLHNEIFGE